MWLIDHSEGCVAVCVCVWGGGGGGVLSHAACRAEAYCLITFLTVRFIIILDQ